MAHYRRGLFPLSADPVTYGHLDLIARALGECDELIVLVCQNDTKRGSYLFGLNERVAMMEKAIKLAGFQKISVRKHEGLLVDAFLREGCDVIVRGIRDERDCEEEHRQMRYHDLIYPGIQDKVLFLEASEGFKDVSSSLVKAFVSHGIEVTNFVPVFVKALLEERITRQWKIGITGQMASGKTWVTNRLTDELKMRGYDAHPIFFDQLVRDFYAEASQGAQLVRERFAALLGEDVLTADRCDVQRPILFSRLFDPATPDAIKEEVRELTAPHVLRLYREALRGARGIVLIEWAQLAEMGMGPFVNHRALLVESSDRETFVRERKLTSEQVARVARTQWDPDKKSQELAAAAHRDGCGLILRYENRRASEDEGRQMIAALADEILRHVPASFKMVAGGAS